MLVCMADTIPKSQFFITLRPCPTLNGQHTCIGRVIKGQQIIEQLGDVEVDKDDRPLAPITIARAGELEYKGPVAPQVSTEAEENADAKESRKHGADAQTKVAETTADEKHLSRRRSRSPRDDRRDKNHGKRRREKERDYRPYRENRDHPRRSSTPRRYKSPERERIDRQERIRENARYRRDPEADKPEVEYKGRGKMVYRTGAAFSSGYGRLS